MSQSVLEKSNRYGNGLQTRISQELSREVAPKRTEMSDVPSRIVSQSEDTEKPFLVIEFDMGRCCWGHDNCDSFPHLYNTYESL